MKAIQCDKCGSIEMIKSGDIYTCQACGTNFDAKADKLKQVSLDHSEDIQRLFKAAWRAKELGNYEGAQGYYDEILGKNPDSWEALFNTVYLRFMRGKVGEVNLHASQMAKALPTIIELVHDEYEPDEQDAALVEIEEDIEELNILFESGSEYLQKVKKNSANLIMATGSITGLLSGAAAKIDASSEFATSRALSAMMLSTFGDCVDEKFGEEIKTDTREAVKDVMLRAWKGAAAIYKSIGKYSAESAVADSIRKWEPGYQTDYEKMAEKAAKETKEKREKAEQKQQARNEAIERNKKPIIGVIVAIVVVIIAALAVYFLVISPGEERNKAYEAAISSNDYAAAAKQLESLGDYKDSAEQAKQMSKLAEAQSLCNSGDVYAALDVLAEFPDDNKKAAKIRSSCEQKIPKSIYDDKSFIGLSSDSRAKYLETYGDVTTAEGDGHVDYTVHSEDLLSQLGSELRSHLTSDDIVIRVYDETRTFNYGFPDRAYRKFVQYQFDGGWVSENLDGVIHDTFLGIFSLKPYNSPVWECSDADHAGWLYNGLSSNYSLLADGATGATQLIIDYKA